MKNNKLKVGLLLPLSLGVLPAAALAADTATIPSNGWQKPSWLTDLSGGVKESYDDNVLMVSGQGLKPQSSWVTAIDPTIGFNFLPFLGGQTILQTLSLSYAPDIEFYHNAPAESYTANRFHNAIKGQSGAFSFGLDNAFLYNDGNRVAETYAVNPSSSSAALQYDKYRSNLAHRAARERRNQYQDRNTTFLQYDWNAFFIRPTASLLYYGLNTYQHDTSVAPYKGYQNYVNRYDVNGGADLGYKLNPEVALTLGYRYGSQYQEQFSAAINNNTVLNGKPYDPYASNDYQRLLLGLEGKPLSWLEVKLAGGPDFRDYNPNAPINDDHYTTYYGKGEVKAELNDHNSLAFNYEAWQWVSSTGYVPDFESSYALTYHWTATSQLGVDLGTSLLEADYTSGNDLNGSAPSVRDDLDYGFSGTLTYAFTSHFSARLSYNYDLGRDNLSTAQLTAPGVPAAVGASAAYRNFEHQVVSLGLAYKF